MSPDAHYTFQIGLGNHVEEHLEMSVSAKHNQIWCVFHTCLGQHRFSHVQLSVRKVVARMNNLCRYRLLAARRGKPLDWKNHPQKVSDLFNITRLGPLAILRCCAAPKMAAFERIFLE